MNKILIIDDESLIRQSLLHVSKIRGYSAKTAGTAKEGLAIWKSWCPDLVFLDLILPDHNGLALMENAPSSAKVVLMSAYDQYGEKAMKKGAHLFLIKPFEDIFKMFDQVLAHFQQVELKHDIQLEL